MDEQSRSHQDVRAPRQTRSLSSLHARKINEAHLPRHIPRHPRLFRIGAVFLIIAASVAGIFIIGSARAIPRSVERGIEGVSEGVRDLTALNMSRARENFARARDAAGSPADNPWGAAQAFFSGVPEFFQDIAALAESGIGLSDDVEYVEAHALDAMLVGDGGEVLARLARIAKALQEIRAATQSLASRSNVAGTDTALPEFMPPFSFDADSASRFLDAALVWLRAPEGRRIAVLLQNPAEMRPAGGFLGSFAEITVRDDGKLVSSTVRDILEADRTFLPDIAPPQPLRGIVRRWKAADANWFFDFPTSAATVLRFLEGSELYRRTSRTFDGIIAISPRVAGDILLRTGPVPVAEVGTFNADNFLTMLQKDVQTRQASGDSFPKKTLRALFETLRARLSALDAHTKRDITGLVAEWIERRDIMVYVKGAGLQDMLEQYGMGGEVLRLPEDFEGDYLAVVDANVGGGKTDGVIAQSVTWESQLNTDGRVANHLVITRTHGGAASPYSWNRLPNDDYLQVFVPERAELVNLSGGRKVPAGAREFPADPLVAEIELGTEESAAFPQVATHLESGKRVFATRVLTSLGEQSRVVMDYTHRMFLNPRDGTAYRFVFERQAGTVRDYHFTVSAPVGFRFRENGLPVWDWTTSTPPGRFVIDLTLQSIGED